MIQPSKKMIYNINLMGTLHPARVGLRHKYSFVYPVLFVKPVLQ